MTNINIIYALAVLKNLRRGDAVVQRQIVGASRHQKVQSAARRSTNALINARLLKKRNCTLLALTPIDRYTAIRLWALGQ